MRNQITRLKQQVQSSRGVDKPLYNGIELSLPPSVFSHILKEPATQRHVIVFNIPAALPTTLEQDSPVHERRSWASRKCRPG